MAKQSPSEPEPGLRAALTQVTVEAPTMLSGDDIIALTRTSRRTIERAVKEGTFPRPVIMFGVRTHRWLTADYVAWVEEQAAKGKEPRVRAHRS